MDAIAPGTAKPKLSLARIVQMNVGFLGLQFSFGLQQNNMGPIYTYLGSSEAAIPLLSMAGPMTGLIVQPIIGALSDRTLSRWGRRTPYFVIGAILCSICLFAMPYSNSVLMAASLLWVLDAANNITMEPYRAYVSDRLAPPQRPFGFLSQSAFTGLAQTMAYLTPSLLVWWGISVNAVDANNIPIVTHIAFTVGAVLSISTILFSVLRVRELPLSTAEVAEIARAPASIAQTFRDIANAIRDMPPTMRQLALPMLCQWYAMFCYWQYITFAIGRALFDTSDPKSTAFRQANLVSGQVGAFYNFMAFLMALALVPLARRFGAKPVHAVCLSASGLAMLLIPQMHSETALFVPMMGIGLGWAGMMGNPYIMLADAIPPERTGIYMGIFNMFIVIPMLIQTVTLPLIYNSVLGGDPRNVLMFAGVVMIAGAVATLTVRSARSALATVPA